MDKILRLFEKCKDYNEVIKKRDKRLKRLDNYNQKKADLVKLLSKSEEELILKSRYEDDLANLEKEIDKLNIMNTNITSIDELDTIEDDEILGIKFKLSIDTLVSVWQDNDEKTIVLNKKVKQFFEKIRLRSCYKVCKSHMYNVLKSSLTGFVFTNVKFEDRENDICISNGNEQKLYGFYKNNKEVSNFLFTILLNNVKNKTRECILQKKACFDKIIIENNNALQGTKFYIKDVDGYINELLLDTINQIACKERKDFMIDKDMTEHNFTEEFTAMLFCIQHFTVKPNDKMIEVIFLNFFDVDKVQKSLFAYLCLYGEVSYFLLTNKLPNLVAVKEKLCGLIIKSMGVDKVRVDLPYEQLKLEIGSHYFAFKEVLEFFIKDSTRIIFIAAYFDGLCDSLYRYILARKSITIQESVAFIDTINYIFEISGIEKTLNSYTKMHSLECVLKSNLIEIERNYNSGVLYLSNEDVCTLVEALFNPSEKRSEVLRKIQSVE